MPRLACGRQSTESTLLGARKYSTHKCVCFLRLLDADLPLELDVERLSDDGSSGSSEGDESDSAITGSSAYSTASEGGETLDDEFEQQQVSSEEKVPYL